MCVCAGDIESHQFTRDMLCVSVQVKILDINDNPPVFKQSVLTIGVSRDTGYRSSITNLQVRYSICCNITGNKTCCFQGNRLFWILRKLYLNVCFFPNFINVIFILT